MSKNEHLARYEERKEKIISLLNDTGEYLRENDKADDAESMFKLKGDVEKNLFSVVLIGEFSVGKSTFLNALMHRRMLPSFKKETTATVNFLRHTSQAPNGEAGIVYYRNGATKILPDLNVDTIARFVSTTGDTKEGTIAQTVEKVDLFLDSKFLQDGVMLVDSPGLNGITENLEAITRRQIKESHACIFMFSTDHPGTKTEFEILRDLRTECNSIFIVLNKIEEIKAGEGETVESVIEHLKKNYMKQFPDATLPEIYPISAYTALAARDKNVPLERDANVIKDAAYYAELESMSRLGNFEDRLFRYLTEGERTREQLSEPIKKVSNTLVNEREDLDAQIKTLEESRSTAELEQQKLALEEGIANLQKERQNLTKPVKDRFNTTMRDFKDKISARCSDICRRVEAGAEAADNLDDLQTFAAEIPESLKKQFVNLSQRLEDDLREDLMLVVDESVEYFDGLQETLSNISGGELKIYNREVKLTATEVGKNMEAMEKTFQAKRREMEEIEKEISAAEVSRAKARKLERRKEDLQRQLKEISSRRNAVLDTFVIPAVERRTRKVKKLRDRRGLWGWVAQIYVGKKEYEDEVEIVDSSAHDEAEKQRKEILENIDSERGGLQKEMAKYSNQDSGSSEEFEAEIQRKTKRLEKMNAEYKADVEKYMASLDADAAKARKKVIREIKDYIENFAEENIQSINKYLAGTERKMFEAVKAMIETRVNTEIERQQKKMDMLIEDSKASDAERDEKLQKATTARDTVIELLKRVMELEVELDDMTDVIEEA
ncbi:MAG: dynamin family protein [Selenomonadaceae bacterium]|nr:dynamin family protein [Selenomonadaceae bacterium]